MDINIRGLRVYSHIGVFEEEKRDGQEFLVDITCTLNDEYSYDTDELNRTVNYGGVCDMVIDYIESVRCDLIETAAEETIVETEVDDIQLFASAKPFADNYIKTHEEPFFITFFFTINESSSTGAMVFTFISSMYFSSFMNGILLY